MQEMMQRMQALQQQLEILQHQLGELEQVKESITAVNDSDNEQEVLVPLGAGVFVKGKFSETDKVFMNVGANVVVKKAPKDAEEIVVKQIEQLKNIGEQMNQEVASISQLLQMIQVQQMQPKEENS